MLDNFLPGDSELDAFIIDCFPDTFKLFSNGMDRIAKTNSLLIRHAPAEICAQLSQKYPERLLILSDAKLRNDSYHPEALEQRRWILEIKGEFGHLNWDDIQRILNEISMKCQQIKIHICSINPGSIKLELLSSAGDLEKIKSFFASSNEVMICGHEIQFVEPKETTLSRVTIPREHSPLSQVTPGLSVGDSHRPSLFDNLLLGNSTDLLEGRTGVGNKSITDTHRPELQRLDKPAVDLLADSSQLHLLIINPHIFKLVQLPNSGSVAIGRSRENDVHVEDESISRRHAVLHMRWPIQVEDLGGANGTVVSGSRLAAHERRSIDIGATIEVGNTLLTLLRLSTATTAGKDTAPGILGSCRPMGNGQLRVVPGDMQGEDWILFQRIATGALPVLIEGEVGVGKGVLAEQIRQHSGRLNGLYRLDCAAIPPALAESMIFGHAKAAFSSAIKSKSGLLEEANGGTLFIDDISEMPLELQRTFLRFIQSGEIQQLGSTQSKKVDVRIIAATNRNLQQLTADGLFRIDLYHRLNVISLYIPPLRQRVDQIEPLARMFLELKCNRIRGQNLGISSAAIETMRQHSWPGNIRELELILMRAALFCTGPTIEPGDLQLSQEVEFATVAAQPSNRLIKDGKTQEWEEKVRATLAQCSYNQMKAAEVLGISRTTLVKILDEHPDIRRPRK